MRVKSLTELKLLLWEAILATLVVTAASSIIAAMPHVEWKHHGAARRDPGAVDELFPAQEDRTHPAIEPGSRGEQRRQIGDHDVGAVTAQLGGLPTRSTPTT